MFNEKLYIYFCHDKRVKKRNKLHLLKITALRYNLHNIKFTLLKYTIQWFLVYSELYNHHHYLILEHFHHLQKKPCTY